MHSTAVVLSEKMRGMSLVAIAKALHTAKKVAIDVYVLGRMRSVGVWPLREVECVM